jgi:2-C-methyl-D-erythritol 4-phosphate cytidylyltransferase
MKSNTTSINDLGVVIVAGGSSSRFGQEDKLLIQLNDRPIIVHAIQAFLTLLPREHLVIVTSLGREIEINQLIQQHLNVDIKTVTGGQSRSESSLNGLKALNDKIPYCAVHDAARPFIKPETIKACYESLKLQGSAVLAHPVTDTIKVVDKDNKVLKTPPRASLCAAETPQMFKAHELIRAYESFAGNPSVTDEAMAMELAGHQVFLHLHEEDNRKITYSSDLK